MPFIRKLITYIQSVGQNWSTRQCVSVTLLLALAATLTITYFSIQSNLGRQYTQIENHVRTVANLLATNTSIQQLNAEFQQLEKSLTPSREPQMQYTALLIDSQGDIVRTYSTLGGTNPIDLKTTEPLPLPKSYTQHTTLNKHSIEIWQPVYLDNNTKYWIKIDASTHIRGAKPYLYELIHTTIFLIVVLISVLLSRNDRNESTNNISRYTNFAHQMDQCHGEQVKVINSSIELEHLGMALNEASTRLHNQSNVIQKALKDLERLAAFPENSPYLMMSINAQGEANYINPSAHQTLIELNISHDALYQILPDNIMEISQQCIFDQRAATDIEVIYREHTFLWTFAPVTGQEIVHAYAMDISSRKIAENTARDAYIAKYSAEQANDAKSKFLANMSHELRTPLNAIIGYSEMIEDEINERGYKELNPDIQKIHSAGNHLLNLINEILDLSKIEAGKTEFFLESIKIEKLMEEIINTIEPMLSINNNQLDTQFDPDISDMYTDVTKIKQIICNILSNANKFTHQGSITFKVGKNFIDNDEWVCFEIHDSGIGMTKEQLNRVFQPFTQAEKSTTRRYGGTGLGLAISYRLCEMMGGTINVSSLQNVGTRFVVQFPIHIHIDEKKVVNI